MAEEKKTSKYKLTPEELAKRKADYQVELEKRDPHGAIVDHIDGSKLDTSNLVYLEDFAIKKDGKAVTDKHQIRGIKAAFAMIPVTERSQEQEIELRRKAQQGMMEVKRKRKNISDICNDILSLDAKDLVKLSVNEEIADKIEKSGLNITMYDLMVLKMCEEASKGNVKAFSAVRDSAGDKPTDKQEVTATISEGDKALMDKISKRLGIDSDKED